MTRSAWMVVVAAALALAACGGDDGNGSTGGNPPPPAKPAGCTPAATAPAKFSADVHPILTASCKGCHGDGASLPNFASADAQVSYDAVKGFVDTANPAQSVLLVKGNGGAGHGGGDKLSDADSATIQAWIANCAQND